MHKSGTSLLPGVRAGDACLWEEMIMPANDALKQLATMLLSGDIEVVDLAVPLGEKTPLIKLPPPFKNTPQIKVHAISNYDADGPYWSWNWLEIGEHSGTHFDAPVHWITGKDYSDGTTDRLPVQKLVAPVNVIDCSRETAADEDFLLTADGVKAWEQANGAIGKGEWVVMRTGWFPRNRSEAEFLNVRDNMPHSPGPTVDCIEYLVGKGIVGWVPRPWAPTPARPGRSIRPTRRTTSCTRTTVSGSRALPTSTSCRRKAPS